MMIMALVIIAVALLVVAWFAQKQRARQASVPVAPLSVKQSALAERLRGHVGMLAAEIGERNFWHDTALETAAEYIEGRLQATGLPVESQEYIVNQKRMRNLVTEIPGTAVPEEILLVGAHYDSVRGSPGANDNASGVAALLELAEQLASQRFRRTLRLVAFSNEEPPFFKSTEMGSRIYADQARERGDRIIGMVCLETIGYYSQDSSSQSFPFPPMVAYYPDRGNFIAFVADFSSQKLLKSSLAAFRRHSDFPAEQLVAPAVLPGVDWSDHWSFWRVGYPAIMLTDTAPYRYPYYHSWEDTPDKLTYPEFARLVEGVVGMIEDLLNR